MRPERGMPSTDAWVAFITRYRDRVLCGSDTVLYGRNVVDAQGNVTATGKLLTREQYMAVPRLTQSLFDKLGPDVARQVRLENYVRLFDGARKKVRAWEAAHARDDVWNLAP